MERNLITDILEQKVDWRLVKPSSKRIPGRVRAVKEGIINFAGVRNIRVYLLESGERAFDESDVKLLVRDLDKMKKEN